MDAIPNRFSNAVFSTKAALLRAQRTLDDLHHPIEQHSLRPYNQLPLLAAQSVTPLWADVAATEQWHQRSKVTNLRLAAAQLHGCHIPAHATFSFWKQVGEATTERGFQRGRMLQEGCMIPAVGGGLCQLSNAIYQVALDSGCTVLERHRHSRVVPGSTTAANRDATVAWNYIDLRFCPPAEAQLTVELTATHLIVALRSSVPLAAAQTTHETPSAPIGDGHACDTCGAQQCFRKHDLEELQRF